MPQQYPFCKEEIKILMLEGIHEIAVKMLQDAGYICNVIPRSLSSEELMEQIQDSHVVAIRSKTKITSEHLAAAQHLLAVGCFGVGTNQVDLDAAANHAIPVFNAPYGNTRSVAELALAHILWLARRAADKNCKMHQGFWDKSAKGAIEVRDKVLGLIGYGHIGQQVGLLGESVGMHVLFYDIAKRLPLGNAHPVASLEALLAKADFLSLHLPTMPNNRALIGEAEIAKMKRGSYLLNLSRGSLIDFSAVKAAIESKHLAGAGLDVYPAEPKTNKEEFKCDLAGMENVILTPHLGGSTEEAQYNIGVEVASAFIKFIDNGTTTGAVNFPQVELPLFPNSHRILNVHRNVPGVLSSVNKILSDLGANINAQYLNTYKDVGYLIMDVGNGLSENVGEEISKLPTNIKTRILTSPDIS
ncbi:MAG: phosphoglycerate dehydrogenase [Deltaproteobacteria bacterium]|nr:phosphoglycerate dehydrogenase [Deltaproteobacteria bacterium]